MSDEGITSSSALGLTLGVFVCSVLLSLKYLLQLFSDRFRFQPSYERACAGAVAVLAGVVSIEYLIYAAPIRMPELTSLLAACSVVGVLGAVRVYRYLVSERNFFARWRWVPITALLGVTLVQTFLARRVVDQVTAPSRVLMLDGWVPGELLPIGLTLAATDDGTTFPVYRWAADARELERYFELSQKTLEPYLSNIIVRDAHNSRYNCHGWVFTDGKYLLKGGDVDTILEHNGYFAVTSPQPNDIVIYRGRDGVPLHTGLVQGVLKDGVVMVESKWGIEGRYLHPVEIQPYSQSFSFYRTHRPSHVIAIREVPSA